MSIFTNFLCPLLLTTVFSFIAPIFLVGSILVFLCLFGYIPGLQGVIDDIPTLILHFLATFGTGSPLNGLFVISLTCGFVGGLFDIYAYYRCQILRIDS
ncbi:hypothetical protein [Trichormus variabilis]|uniref:Uncharacterized protein n=1 Tax=Trichormus variabilis SAG 1403-4b TaxID=447716 RepID=A0A433UWK7_ANAVA|nr:hypothetical protein [Trichormus variabilis]MBD2626138.1 hypothetical protein [Trichormus variabilis FACHB-164]RUS98245.1 hypothetical protein DSM107003_13330 [Trichormus variabilis SAG 1403-4b]